MKDPFLTGKKIYLNPIQKADLTPKYREWLNDEEVSRYNSHHRFPNYDENMREYFETAIKSKSNLILAIRDKESDEHIGNIALENIDLINRCAELAIMIGDRSYQGKGVGGDACRAIMRHAFNELNLHRIYLGTAEENVGMQKLSISLGMKEEGRRVDAMYKNGKYTDVLEYGVLKDDFIDRE